MSDTRHPAETLIEELLAGGAFLIGEVLVRREGGRILLRHHKAEESGITRRSENPADARFIARFDREGAYRPLKSAPNLPTDWELSLAGVAEARLAIEDFYPAALGMLLARMEGRLRAVDFMETASRQTGMYRVVGRIAPEMAQEVIGRACNPEACQRVILWNLLPGTPLSRLPREKFESAPPASTDTLPTAHAGGEVSRVPIYCAEACNLLIAACRSAVKQAQKAAQPETGPGAGETAG